MALVKRRMSRKKILLLLGLLGAAVIGGLYYVYGTGNSTGSGAQTDAVTQRLHTDLNEVNAVGDALLPSLDSLLGDPRFQELKQFGELPVEQGPTGRKNPFLPF